VELARGPFEATRGLLDAKGAVDGSLPEEVADRERDVVAGERSTGSTDDEQRHAEVAVGGDDAGRDRDGLAGHEREERVEQGDPEHDEIRPARAPDGIDD